MKLFHKTWLKIIFTNILVVSTEIIIIRDILREPELNFEGLFKSKSMSENVLKISVIVVKSQLFWSFEESNESLIDMSFLSVIYSDQNSRENNDFSQKSIIKSNKRIKRENHFSEKLLKSVDQINEDFFRGFHLIRVLFHCYSKSVIK